MMSTGEVKSPGSGIRPHRVLAGPAHDADVSDRAFEFRDLRHRSAWTTGTMRRASLPRGRENRERTCSCGTLLERFREALRTDLPSPVGLTALKQDSCLESFPVSASFAVPGVSLGNSEKKLYVPHRHTARHHSPALVPGDLRHGGTTEAWKVGAAQGAPHDRGAPRRSSRARALIGTLVAVVLCGWRLLWFAARPVRSRGSRGWLGDAGRAPGPCSTRAAT